MTNLASQLGNIAVWLDNGCDPKQAAEELRQLSRKSADEPETGRCECGRFYEQRCPVCGPVENRTAPHE